MPAPLLNYLGPSAGSGAPVMPAGVPSGPLSVSAGGAPSLTPPSPMPSSPMGGPAPQPSGPPLGPPADPSAMGMPGMFPPGAPPAPPQYEAITQSNGTVLLVEKNPDGSPGPVVQIVKLAAAGKGQQQQKPLGQ